MHACVHTAIQAYIHASVHPYILSVCQSVSLSICLSVYQSVCLSVSLSIDMHARTHAHTSLTICINLGSFGSLKMRRHTREGRGAVPSLRPVKKTSALSMVSLALRLQGWHFRCNFIWWFPEIGVPPALIHFRGTFPYKLFILRYPHLWNPP